MMVRIMSVLVLSCLAVPCQDARPARAAEKADGNGYTADTRAATSPAVHRVRLGRNAEHRSVLVREGGTRNKPVFYAINSYNVPVELEFLIEHSANMSANRVLPARFTIPARSTMPTLTLWPTRSQQAWSYRYSYRYIVGDPEAKHTPHKPYRLPFAQGQAYRISQGFNGRYSHHRPASQYAVDFVMPVGTPVHAARAGIVIEVARHAVRGGTNRQAYARRANIVRILHKDGTMALYAHLQGVSRRVTPGVSVSEGQFIATSGNTGFSSGPHLHFVIQKNVGMQMASVPFQFADRHGNGITPQQGMRLTAY